MRVTIQILLQPRFKNNLIELGYKKQRPFPRRVRSYSLEDNCQKYHKVVEFEDDSEFKEKHAKERDKVKELFEFSDTPIVGKRCIGTIDVKEYSGDFDTYLHI